MKLKIHTIMCAYAGGSRQQSWAVCQSSSMFYCAAPPPLLSSPKQQVALCHCGRVRGPLRNIETFHQCWFHMV